MGSGLPKSDGVSNVYQQSHSPTAPRQLVKSPIRHGANVGMNRNLDFPLPPKRDSRSQISQHPSGRVRIDKLGSGSVLIFITRQHSLLRVKGRQTISWDASGPLPPARRRAMCAPLADSGWSSASGWKDPNHRPVSLSIGQPAASNSLRRCRQRRLSEARRLLAVVQSWGVEPLPRGVTFLSEELLRPESHSKRPFASGETEAGQPRAFNRPRVRTTSNMAKRHDKPTGGSGTESRRIIPTSGPGGLSRASFQINPFPWAADLNDSLPTWCLTSSSRQPPLFGWAPRLPKGGPLSVTAGSPPLFFASRTAPSVCCGDRSAPLLRPHPDTLWTRSELQAFRRRRSQSRPVNSLIATFLPQDQRLKAHQPHHSSSGKGWDSEGMEDWG
jgi:hypothetical protein